MKPYLIILLFLSLTFLACEDQGVGPTLNERGTIVYVGDGGGFWAIKADNGQGYRTPELASEFQTVNLRVEFFGVVDDQPNTYMWGHGIKLVWIHSLN